MLYTSSSSGWGQALGDGLAPGGEPLAASGAVSWHEPRDRCTFTVDEAADVRVELTGLSADADVRLLDASGHELADSDEGWLEGSGSDDTLTAEGLAGGDYYLDVELDDRVGSTTYDLSVEASEPDWTLETPYDFGAEPVAHAPQEPSPPALTEGPHTATGLLEVDLGQSQAQGTGFLVSPEHVMTNAHNVFGADGASARSVDFYPGLNGARDGADAHPVETVYYQRDGGFPDGSPGVEPTDWPADDLALLELTEPLDAAQPLDLGWSESGPSPAGQGQDLSGDAVSWAGYPSEGIEQDNVNTPGADFLQWEVAGEVSGYAQDDGALLLSEAMQGAAGASGSPVLRETADGPEAVGVYAGRMGEQPVAASLDGEAYNWAIELIQSDGYLSDADMA